MLAAKRAAYVRRAAIARTARKRGNRACRVAIARIGDCEPRAHGYVHVGDGIARKVTVDALR